MVLTKFVLKYIFVKLQDPEKETELIFFLGLPTNIGGGFSISPTPLKGLYKDSLKICELFRYVKMEICIFGKTQKLIAA